MTDKPFTPRDDPSRWDVLLLFVVPTILLVSIFLYPRSTQILEYKARNPTTLTIIGSNLAHRGTLHIAGNLLGLWVIGGVSFILACACQRKRLYYYSFASYLTILPFFADPFIRSMLQNSPEILATLESVGFSQTVGALVGFLTLAIGLFVSENVDKSIPALPISAGLFLSGFTIIYVNFGSISLVPAVLILSGLLTVGYVVWRASKTVKKPLSTAKCTQFFACSLFVFYAALLFLFPKGVGGGFFGHMAGYLWGYLLPITGIFIRRTYNLISEKAVSVSSTDI